MTSLINKISGWIQNFIGFLLVGFIAVACDQAPKTADAQEWMIQGQAQGTTYTVKYLGSMIEDLPKQFDSLLLRIDRSLSTYDSTSLISKFNRGDTIAVDEMFSDMFNFSKEINSETQGAFDPTIGPLIKAWGWGFSNAEEMDSLKVDSLLLLKGFDKIFLSDQKAYLLQKHARLNYNAIAQGYSVDLMADHLDQLNIHNYYIELGGEIKTSGFKLDSTLWRVGIDRPEEGNESRELIAVVSMNNEAMATSGNYRKFYEKDGQKYSHTIDPKSGFPVRHNLLSASVISKECYRADALATSFMVMGYEKAVSFLKAHPSDLAFLVYAKVDGSYGYYISEELEKRIEKIEVKN